MIRGQILSDQLYNWSDQDEQPVNIVPASASPISGAAAAELQFSASRFVDRAVQAVRQAGVPLRQGTWPRSEVLPLGQSQRGQAGDGLCASGVPRPSQGIFGKLPQNSRHTGSDRQHQSGIVASARAVVAFRYGHRSAIGSGGQHARSAAAHRARSCDGHGGKP